MNVQGILYLIADEALEIVAQKLPAVLSNGTSLISHVQLRVTKFARNIDLQLLKEIAEITHQHQAKVIVNRALDLATLDFVDGIHIGSDGPSIIICRNEIGNAKLIGYSAHSIATALDAAQIGADYLFLSPIYKPISKVDSRPELGLEAIRRLRAKTSATIYALGGITPTNAKACLEAGANGVASLSLLLSEQASELTTEFIAQLGQSKNLT